MDAKKKNRIIVWTSVAIILSVGGYFGYKYLKDSGKLGGKKDGGDTGGGDTGGGSISSGSTSSGSISSGSTPTAEQTALATKYRIWANSTDELSKKYGKKSEYDLDATRSNPYGGTFLRSYAAGKAEYEASLKGTSSSSTATTTASNQKDQITKIASRYGKSIQAHSKGGQYVALNWGATRQGTKHNYVLGIYEKNPSTGAAVSNGSLVWVLLEDNKAIMSGYVTYENGIFKGSAAWAVSGISKGTGNHKYITDFIKSVSNNNIYGVWDWSGVQK